MKNGIAVAGNMVVDMIYPIQGLPKAGELTSITGEVSRSSGGAVCNVIMDLAKLDPELPLTALGRIGNDELGNYVLQKMGEHKEINVDYIKREGVTSFTIVMADEATNQRTFFHCRGANAKFDVGDIDLSILNTKIIHVGYILLLDSLDKEDDEYGTRMARLLHDAQAYGIKTSIDVVSEAGDRFRRIVPPVLRYTDYCIINELEAQQSTGVPLRNDNGILLEGNVQEALFALMTSGVSTWAVIHSPEGGFGMGTDGKFVTVKSLVLPNGYIKGTVGAGDAFCAGVLYGAYQEMPLSEAIELGIASASCSLSECDATKGLRSVTEVMKLYKQMR